MKKLFILLAVIFAFSAVEAKEYSGLSKAQQRELDFRKNLPHAKYNDTELNLRSRYIEVFGERAFLTHGADKLKYTNIMEVMIKEGAAAKAKGRTLTKMGGIGATGLVGTNQDSQ